MASAIEDEELSISLTNNGGRRRQNSGPVPQTRQNRPDAEKRPNQPTPTRATARLGQYNIIKTLGEGSFGKVKLAVHQVSGQKVALKIIARRKLMNRDMAGRIEREIQYLQLLRHPHIIKLYTVITTPTEIIMVLEYAGGELFDYIVQHGKMTEDSARRFFQQMICAVEYCHRHKIVHRDLKPENLLLDEYLNVKIADFGLSNIMTDGNFLKTSCGSPNYAAPEVISGKLYAGPEVDVWSCGVILYVLLVGRLPFDDEYIPSLFKKIAQGNFHIPNYLSSGAVNLIRKMLVVNPVHRITVQEIRQDPWFVKNLPEYLQPPVEEFLDTGVDPNKAIDPRSLAPGTSAAVQDQLHESVIGKLGKTMGYAKDDVQDALGRDEPSAIKDAYLIVRENQIMKTNATLSNNDDLNPFLAQSPPAWNPLAPSSPLFSRPRHAPPDVTAPITRDVDRSRRSAESSHRDIHEARSPTNSIAVLPSSMPDYHRAFMKGQPAFNSPQDNSAIEETLHQQTSAEQAATVRRLKPHSRSQLNVDKAGIKPESMTPLPAKKPRPTKWQFGIRSRNQPLEAIACIYRALKALGAEWEVPESRDQSSGSSDENEDGRSARRSARDESRVSLSGDGYSLHHESSLSRPSSRSGDRDAGSNDGGGGDDDSSQSDYYELPDDPWVIHCRWRKDGMYPPGMSHPSSTHSSRVNLAAEDQSRKRSSTVGSANSGTGSAGSQQGSASHTGPASVVGSISRNGDADDSCYVYMEIQLYQLEREFYLVDFKCSGYERLVEEVIDNVTDDGRMERVSGGRDRPEGSGKADGPGIKSSSGKVRRLRTLGRKTEEKDRSSPFPFLDLASKLIIQLAEAD
ncbi:MAG: hypothetical protein M1819_006527 [Sarea resinae]|nr:MAG: hypothetical protein M1819_000619 [Sarea resinae]KAI9828820.1 MAG: hypothetical protein M1819_006527 [Sarea resinae]